MKGKIIMAKKEENKGKDEVIENLAKSQKGVTATESLLGSIAWLMLRSQIHKHLFITDLEWLIIPPVMLKQMRIFRNQNTPIGYISWASLTQEAEERFLKGNARISPKDWNAGDRLWIIDFISPFGAGNQFLKLVQEQIFKDKDIKILKLKKDGRGMEGVLLKDFLSSIGKEKK